MFKQKSIYFKVKNSKKYLLELCMCVCVCFKYTGMRIQCVHNICMALLGKNVIPYVMKMKVLPEFLIKLNLKIMNIQ